MTAKVARLTRYHKKGEFGVILPEANLLKGLGMENNIHQGGEKQISLLSAEARRWIESQEKKGLCFERFRENILFEGSLDELQNNSFLSVGEAILRVSMLGKKCFDECALFSQGSVCRLSGCAIFAVVEQSGIVRTGDTISIV